MGGHRECTLEELGRGVFDVLVIGGGIVGGRVALDAARAGLRVALVDAGDFGGATSGASARLIHGGLRYLGTGDFRLVRTALRERDVLASRVAPHLVRPLPFVLAAAGGRRSRCAAGHFLRPEMLRGQRVVSAFAGLRVLPRGEEATLHASRDHLLSVGPGGMVSVAGGKLTTHRRIALDALRHLPDRVRPRRLSLSDAPLPGASSVRDLHSRLDGSMVDHLLHLYGSETTKLLGYSQENDNALEKITPGAPDLWAQVYHAIREVWALTAEDVIYRRTTLGLRGFDTPEIRRMISAALEAGAQTPPPELFEPTSRRIV